MIVATPDRARIAGGHYLATLDGWRAVAISLVLIGHGYSSVEQQFGNLALLSNDVLDRANDVLERAGPLGVQIFFGLSGFLITSRLIDEERHVGFVNLTSFYVRRFFRIIPAAFVFLVTVGILACYDIVPMSIGRWLSSLFFLANYSNASWSNYVGHFWSLAVEEHFYFLWPTGFILLATTRHRASFAAIFALLITLWRAVDWKYHITTGPAPFWFRTDIAGDGILWGVVIALLYADPYWKAHIKTFVSSRTIWVGLVALIIFSGLFSESKVRFALFTVKAVAIPLAILGTVSYSMGLRGRILEAQPLKWIGRLSYSIYIWQQLFLVMDPVDLIPQIEPLQYFPINFIAVILMAVASYYLVERRLIRIGHRIYHGAIRRRWAAPDVVSAVSAHEPPRPKD